MGGGGAIIQNYNPKYYLNSYFEVNLGLFFRLFRGYFLGYLGVVISNNSSNVSVILFCASTAVILEHWRKAWMQVGLHWKLIMNYDTLFWL